jgi:hypothetical protein
MKDFAMVLLATAFGLYCWFKIHEGVRHRLSRGWGDLICF